MAIDEKGVSFIKGSTAFGSKTSDLQKRLKTFVSDCSLTMLNQIELLKFLPVLSLFSI